MKPGVAGRAPVALAAVAAAGSAVFLLAVMHPFTFALDEWDFLIDRRAWSVDSFLDPHNEHISVIPVAVYKVLVTVFGMTSQLPFQVALTVCTLACATLVWVYVRRRLGDWLALAAVLPLLFLGSGAINLIYPFQVTMMSSLAFGLGALIAVERRDRSGDRIACALLTGSVISHSPGLPFIVAIAVAVLLRPGRRSRAWIFLIPAGVYAVWWIGWGVGPDYPVTLSSVLHVPVEVFEGYASSIGSLLGLTTGLDGDPISSLTFGRPLLVVLIVAGAYRLWRLRRVPPGLLPALALGVAFWGLLSLVAADDPDRMPTDGRYQYLGAVFVILALAELYRGVRLGAAATAAVVAVAALAVAANLRAFDLERKFFEGVSEQTRVNLGAGEIAGAAADPESTPAPYATLGPYLEAVEEYGSPAYSEAEIAGGPETVRVGADQELGRLYGLAPVPAEEPVTEPRQCRLLSPGDPASVPLRPGTIVLQPNGEAAMSLSRFATPSASVDLGSVPPGATSLISIPADGSSVPWTLTSESEKVATVCTVAQD